MRHASATTSASRRAAAPRGSERRGLSGREEGRRSNSAYAEKRGFQLAVIAGPEEFAQGVWKVKDLAKREETAVNEAELVGFVKSGLSLPESRTAMKSDNHYEVAFEDFLRRRAPRRCRSSRSGAATSTTIR